MEEVEEGEDPTGCISESILEEDKYCDGEGGHIVQKNFGVWVGQSITGTESCVVFVPEIRLQEVSASP